MRCRNWNSGLRRGENSHQAADLAVVTHLRVWPVTHSRLLTMIEQQHKLRLCVSHASSWTVRACRYRLNIEARVRKCDSTWLKHCWPLTLLIPKNEGTRESHPTIGKQTDNHKGENDVRFITRARNA